jgi:hypothetical protein
MKACILLGVWGEQHIKEFLELSLYSLLSPGNIPAFTSKYQTRFVFLTKESSIEEFDKSPAFQKLKTHCEIEFIFIDDLIMTGNYSTTLTFAFDRAIKQTGAQMLETYFVFLTADYIMADGSLTGLMRYMDKGYSGIQAGNYQVIEEEMKPYFVSRIDREALSMTISPRELVKKSLGHLHPISIASICNDSHIHNYHANRFFYNYSPEALAGRFYLLHMLCIKPETMDYQIGSSCDYSFILEMCPSGNTAIITDSDDYLVIENQPHGHDLKFIEWGEPKSERLIKILAEWTTAQHRKNSATTIYYHANDLDDNTKLEIDSELNQFIDGISRKLNKIPAKPHRGHPYWIGAVKALENFKAIGQQAYFERLISLHESGGIKSKLLYPLFGKQPNVFPWHFRWRGFKSMREALLSNLSGYNKDNIIFLYDDSETHFLNYASWLKRRSFKSHHMKSILNSDKEFSTLESRKIKMVVYFICMKQISNLPAYLALIKRILAPGGKATLVISNQNNHCPQLIYDFQKEVAHRINILKNSELKIENIQTLYDNFSFYGAFIYQIITRGVKFKPLRILHYIAAAIPGGIICTVRNCFSYFIKPKKGHCTDIIITLSNN